MRTKPAFATFVSGLGDIDSLVSAGADRVIIDFPAYSARCISAGDGDDFALLDELFSLTRESEAEAQLNLDFMERDSDEERVCALVAHCRKLGLDSFRVQSLGMAVIVRCEFPDARITLAMETGNTNSRSARFFRESELFAAQALPPILGAGQIREIVRAVPQTRFELQVFGPFLLQQSARFFLSVSAGDVQPRSSERVLAGAGREAEGRGPRLEFYENRFGTFTQSSFVLSLACCFSELCDLGLDCWVFDGRTLGRDCTVAVLEHFRALFNERESGDCADLARIPDCGGRELTSGFFRGGFNEESRFAAADARPEDALIGRVTDVVSGRCCAVEVEPGRELVRGGMVVFESPNRIGPVSDSIERICLADGSACERVSGPALAVIGWRKGVVPGTLVSEAGR